MLLSEEKKPVLGIHIISAIRATQCWRIIIISDLYMWYINLFFHVYIIFSCSVVDFNLKTVVGVDKLIGQYLAYLN